jgi:hypothetical protein
MRYTLIIIAALFCFTSCDNYITKSIENTGNTRTVIQSFAAACCGGCGQRVLIDNLKDEQQTLQVECNLEWGCCRMCMFGTEKHIDKYSGKFIVQRTIYKPIYDTISLKNLFPKLERVAFFDSAQLLNPILSLTSSDTLLISRALSYVVDTTCQKSYLLLIRGFVFVKTENVKYKKAVNFKGLK